MWYLIVSTPDLCTLTYFTQNEADKGQDQPEIYIRLIQILLHNKHTLSHAALCWSTSCGCNCGNSLSFSQERMFADTNTIIHETKVNLIPIKENKIQTDYLCFSYCFCSIIHDSVFIYTVHQCLFYIGYYFLGLKNGINMETIIARPDFFY